VDFTALEAVLERFDLMPAWKAYCVKAGKRDPLDKFESMSRLQQYPDITDILARKVRGRRQRASLSFAEKLAILDKLRKDVAPIVRARQARGRLAEEHARRAPSDVPKPGQRGFCGGRPEASARRMAAAASWHQVCEHLTVALRGWPIREIERGVRLSESQRVSFYELVTASLKAADTLASACPAETALTPAGRMDIMRKRLAAVRDATAAIRPALLRFYGALDQGQKVRFAEMS
jgi:LTXXQ motif family protein